MTEQLNGPLWEVMKLVIANADKYETLSAGIAAKREITTQAFSLWKQLAVLDDLIIYLQPDSGWRRGWAVGYGEEEEKIAPFPLNSPTTPRNTKIINIANELADAKSDLSDDWSITSREVAERLESDGYPGSLRSLAIATGNVLTRNGWNKIGDGEYEFDVEKYKKQVGERPA